MRSLVMSARNGTWRALVVLALIVAACGDDSSESDTARVETAEEAGEGGVAAEDGLDDSGGPSSVERRFGEEADDEDEAGTDNQGSGNGGSGTETGHDEDDMTDSTEVEPPELPKHLITATFDDQTKSSQGALRFSTSNWAYVAKFSATAATGDVDVVALDPSSCWLDNGGIQVGGGPGGGCRFRLDVEGTDDYRATSEEMVIDFVDVFYLKWSQVGSPPAGTTVQPGQSITVTLTLTADSDPEYFQYVVASANGKATTTSNLAVNGSAGAITVQVRSEAEVCSTAPAILTFESSNTAGGTFFATVEEPPDLSWPIDCPDSTSDGEDPADPGGDSTGEDPANDDSDGPADDQTEDPNGDAGSANNGTGSDSDASSQPDDLNDTDTDG